MIYEQLLKTLFTNLLKCKIISEEENWTLLSKLVQDGIIWRVTDFKRVRCRPASVNTVQYNLSEAEAHFIYFFYAPVRNLS